ncbi:hypothetical protein [Streptomyces viridosporus]
MTVGRAKAGERVGTVRHTDILGGVCDDVLTLKQVTEKRIVPDSVGAESNREVCDRAPHTVRLTPAGDDLVHESGSEASGRPKARLSKVGRGLHRPRSSVPPPAGRTRTALPGDGVRAVRPCGRPDEGPVANGPGPPVVPEDPGNLHTVHGETPGEGGNPLRRPRVRPPGRRRGGRGAAAGRFA